MRSLYSNLFLLKYTGFLAVQKERDDGWNKHRQIAFPLTVKDRLKSQQWPAVAPPFRSLTRPVLIYWRAQGTYVQLTPTSLAVLLKPGLTDR